MAGLTHPEDLAAWQDWQSARHRVRRLRGLLRPPPSQTHRMIVGGSRPRLLVVVESLSASNRAAFLAPLAHLDLTDVALLSSADLGPHLPDHDWTERPWPPAVGGELSAVLAPGHYTELGHQSWQVSREREIPFLVAQHGLMTPLAPPLPEEAHLLSWSEADASFWWSGRTGRSTVVGSQLLCDAGRHAVGAAAPSGTPTYLGQLHGAELKRRDLARAAGAFCRTHGATYRPHPSETDRLSRWQHERWRHQGITVDDSPTPLRELPTPVVGVFSTGVLEAAAGGIPAWVDFPNPPTWLREFWERYDMRPYGGEPTPAPPRPTTEPAAAIAQILRSHL